MNDITVTKNETSGSERWDVEYTADQAATVTKTLETAGTLLDRDIKVSVTTPAGSIDALNAAKGRVSNNSVTVTATLTKTAGYIDGGPLNGSSATVTAAELVSGTKTITGSGTTDVTNYAEASVAAGSASTPATSVTANPSISVSSGGLITASVSASQSVTPSVSTGWVSSGTAGTVSVSGSNTQQLSTQAAQTITPTTSDQTIAAGKYLTGAQTIKGDANLVAANIAKDVSIFGVTGTHEGGGGGGAALVYEDNVSASTTSTSETIIKTVTKTATEMNMGRQATLVAVVRDNAGTQTNHYVGGTYCTAVFSTTSDTYVTRDWGAWVYHSQTVSKGVVKTYTEPYGVYPKYSRSGSAVTIQICSRYTSQSSYRTNTISGTYNIKIYSISPTGIDLPDV